MRGYLNTLKEYFTLKLVLEFVSLIVMRFRKPWLRVKLVNFDFGAKLSSNDYNESNTPNPKSLAHVGSEKSLVELKFQKMNVFTFFTYFSRLKSLLFTLSHN